MVTSMSKQFYVPTPKSKTCFVYDEVGTVGRYYDSGFKWDGTTAPNTIQRRREAIYPPYIPIEERGCSQVDAV